MVTFCRADYEYWAIRDWDGDVVKAAIDFGGGQVCDVSGVIKALDEAGYKIVPKEEA